MQFLPSWDIFWVKGTKNYSCNGEFFELLVFILVIGVFLSGILRVCCFCHKSPIFFWAICWHFLSLKRVPWCDWSRRLIDWSIKRALRVFQSLKLCQQKTYGHIICGALVRWGRNCSEILRQIITINIYFFMTLKVTSLRILHIYYIQMLALCETCTNNHLGTLRKQVKKLNWNDLHIQAFWELLRQTVFSSLPPVNPNVTLYSCRPRKFSLTTSS